MSEPVAATAVGGRGATGAGGRSALPEVLGISTRLGLTSFGGPIAHLGSFREEYVVRRGWLVSGQTPAKLAVP